MYAKYNKWQEKQWTTWTEQKDEEGWKFAVKEEGKKQRKKKRAREKKIVVSWPTLLSHEILTRGNMDISHTYEQ